MQTHNCSDHGRVRQRVIWEFRTSRHQNRASVRKLNVLGASAEVYPNLCCAILRRRSDSLSLCRHGLAQIVADVESV